jgi:hypothetical protein
VNGFKVAALLLLALGLESCAPTSSSGSTSTSSPSTSTQASSGATITALSVNPNGVLVCIAGGRAFVLEALVGAGRAVNLPASSAAWRAGDWWLALPKSGLAYKATGVPSSVSFVAQPTLLSSRFVFTNDGDVFDYSATKIGHVGKLPSSILENGERTFVISGNVVFEIGKAVERKQTLEMGGTYSLVPDGENAALIRGLAARAGGFTYRVDGTSLIASNTAERETARVTLGAKPTQLIASSGFIALATGATLRVLRAGDLSPVLESSCGGGA